MSNGQKSGKKSLIYDPRIRSIFFQFIAAACVAGFFWQIIDNASTNMAARGITTGFGFLDNQAGFGIIQSIIEYSETDTYARTFTVGLLNTLLVSGLGIFFATLIGFLMGIARLSSNWLIRKLALCYIELFRNIPLLLQIFFWYFAVLRALPSPRDSMSLGESVFLNIRGLYLPEPIPGDGFSLVWIAIIVGVVASFILHRYAKKIQAETGRIVPVFLPALGMIIGLPLVVFFLVGSPLTLEYPVLTGFNFRDGITIIPEFMALLVALTIYTSAFIAEVVRSGIEAVSHGQTEAASALGLSNGQRLRLIVIPQSMRVIIPPLTNQYLNLTKNSSLATAIGYPDLVSVFAGTTLNQTGQAVEIIFMTMGVYLTMSLVTSAAMNFYNSRKALVER
ncbi:MAG: amino acid ABC transporter permease [unclassified Hahellaceae]|nr:amino acid ABC transporter permease [Hahellaceae bacterium]|tara:strand:+ start:81027 stop:82205 length:1179 start_codon:yes stop_codon:yes gene_type:complete